MPPPDRSQIGTEQRNPRSMNLHTLSIAECVKLINEEDRAVLSALEKARPALTAFIEAVEPRFLPPNSGRLIYIGAGTSGRLGVLDASEAPPTFQLEEGRIIGLIAGGDSSLRKSSEGKEDDPNGAAETLSALNLTPNDTILGIAAGATTPYVLGALELAKNPPPTPSPLSSLSTHHSPNPLTALLTCSPIQKPPAADHLILLDTGPEVLTGSTRMKAGTATKLALNTISTTLMVRSGRVYQNLMVDLRASNDKLRDRAARVVSTLTDLPRDAAFSLLDQAGGAAKTAIVMHRRATTRAAAEKLLADAHGRLGEILDLPGR
jgi:N-acetylmuramic acid 6-phosphate etherase